MARWLIEYQVLDSGKYLIINGAALMCCVVFDYAYRFQLLTALMLFLPLIDPKWSWPKTSEYDYKNTIRILLLVSIVFAVVFDAIDIETALSVVLFTALPEEWFFRAYCMTRIENLLSAKDAAADHREDVLVEAAQTGGRNENVSRLWTSVLKPENTANLETSVFFSMLHLPTQGVMGLSVFVPSLVFGWIYQKTRDLILVILLHGLSNLFFFILIKRSLILH